MTALALALALAPAELPRIYDTPPAYLRCTIGHRIGRDTRWVLCARIRVILACSGAGREAPTCERTAYAETYRETRPDVSAPYDLQILDRGQWVTVLDHGEVAP